VVETPLPSKFPNLSKPQILLSRDDAGTAVQAGLELQRELSV
jgi:hypothetical protein